MIEKIGKKLVFKLKNSRRMMLFAFVAGLFICVISAISILLSGSFWSGENAVVQDVPGLVLSEVVGENRDSASGDPSNDEYEQPPVRLPDVDIVVSDEQEVKSGSWPEIGEVDSSDSEPSAQTADFGIAEEVVAGSNGVESDNLSGLHEQLSALMTILEQGDGSGLHGLLSAQLRSYFSVEEVMESLAGGPSLRLRLVGDPEVISDSLVQQEFEGLVEGRDEVVQYEVVMILEGGEWKLAGTVEVDR